MAQSIPFGSRSTADQVLAGVDLSRNRVVVVTGCNSSIGFETMKALHANGARVIGLARTLDEAAAACNAVGRSLTPLSCDPMDPLSVDAAVESIRSLSSPLDAVVVNSFDLRCFADHIAQFVLVNRLAELVQYGTGRIVIGSKHADITDAPLDNVMLETLGAERIYDASAFHEQAKLATALFAKELSRRLEARGVAVNVFFSGAATTWQSREARAAAQRLIQAFLRYFTSRPHSGPQRQLCGQRVRW